MIVDICRAIRVVKHLTSFNHLKRTPGLNDKKFRLVLGPRAFCDSNQATLWKSLAISFRKWFLWSVTTPLTMENFRNNFRWTSPEYRKHRMRIWGHCHLHIAVKVHIAFCCPLLNQGLVQGTKKSEFKHFRWIKILGLRLIYASYQLRY